MNDAQIPGLALLLADSSPSLRLLVLRDLMGRPAEDPEVQELVALQAHDPLVSGLLMLQSNQGGWNPALLPGSFPGGEEQAAAYALLRLGFLGLDRLNPAVVRAAEFLFLRQEPDGSWPLPETYRGEPGEEEVASMPLQTALPLAGLAACGYAADPRSERGYAWLLAQRLEDGSWPTGWKSGNLRGVGGYRRLPHSRWGCRSNTTAALLALALHPEHRTSEAAHRGLDLLLGCELHDRRSLGFEVARLTGQEPPRGYLTYFARFDPALVLSLCWRTGASLEDMRIADIQTFVLSAQGPYGLWEYPARPQVSRWVSFDLLRSLSRLAAGGEWVGLEPRTPFQPYPSRRRRF